ncbi:cell division protein SepF [uncultured Methanobrevibacter sp.]|uniref:cell division protein SepF n=1 Tax=uncultured Methanobrevibacter sp. TaxID=253161 RepID=UPI00260139DE|nr:cell division protein SepF [uncultured Methanobrevibacter sp.]
MGFTDNLKRSLGFEETESPDGKDNDEPTFSSMFHDLTENIKNGVSNLQNSARDYSQNSGSAQDYEPNVNHNQDNYHNYNPTQEPMPTSAPIFNDADDYVIVPEQSYYEIALIRPKSIDDVNYVVDQVIEEKNPVILDLSFLEKESPANFRLAGDKIKKMRERYGAQALLLARSEEKNLIIVSPNKVKLVNKNK